EGDFTESELNLLNAKGGIAVNLGRNRLRSETAIICLLSQLKMLMAF
ncbi:MAG: 16S rRNA (uracil(1498)-N(3))-methyltransferase, partial [Cytophagaceae bacterium]